MQQQSDVSLPLTVQVKGRTWRIFDVEFTTEDGRKYGFYIYAISREHASYIVEDIKRTAKLADGDIVSFYKHDTDGSVNDDNSAG